MAGVLEAMVGPRGAIFISVGLIILILGNYLSWSLLAAEVLFSAVKNKTMPAFQVAENKKKSPAAALWASNIVIQVFLLLSPLSEYAFLLALKMISAMALAPYFLVAAYGTKLAWTEKADESPPRRAGGSDPQCDCQCLCAGHDLRAEQWLFFMNSLT